MQRFELNQKGDVARENSTQHFESNQNEKRCAGKFHTTLWIKPKWVTLHGKISCNALSQSKWVTLHSKISCNALSQTKWETLRARISCNASSQTKGETLHGKISCNTLSQSKWETLRSKIRATQKWDQVEEAVYQLTVSTFTSPFPPTYK